MTQCQVSVFAVWSLSCIYSARYLPRYISRFDLTFLYARVVFNNRSTHSVLQSRSYHALLLTGPSYTMLYFLTKEKESHRKSYVHVNINGGDSAIWQYVTM